MRACIRLLALSTVVAVLVLAGCGGGGGGGGSPGAAGPGGAPVGITPSYLLYLGSIHGVDPLSPGSPITLETGNLASSDAFRRFVTGAFDAATVSLSNIHVHTVVYARDDGRLYRLATVRTGTVPVPEPLTNESAAQGICGAESADDYQNPLNSRYVYELPGVDADCATAADNVWKMARLGMGGAEAPLPARKVVASGNSPTTGALAYWLVVDGGALRRCDPDMIVCGASLAAVANTAKVLDSFDRHLLLAIDGTVRTYDDEADVLSPILYTGVTDLAASDATHFYFLSGTTVQRVPADGSAPAVQMHAAAENLATVWVTTSRVLFSTTSALFTMDKTPGSTPTPLGSVSAGGILVPIVRSGSRLFYSTVDSAGNTTAASILDTGAGLVQVPDAFWGGFSTSGTQSGLGSAFAIDKVVRVDGIVPGGASVPTVSLRSVDPASGASSLALGSMPTGFLPLGCVGVSDGATLCMATDLNPPGTNVDMFFMNVFQQNSLQRVTNTPGLTESLPLL